MIISESRDWKQWSFIVTMGDGTLGRDFMTREQGHKIINLKLLSMANVSIPECDPLMHLTFPRARPESSNDR
jgi:hypothetical protein